MSSISSIRTEYTKASLDVDSVHLSPVEQFSQWFTEALAAKVPEPTAMNLATANEHGRPTSRMVLLKGVEQSKFVFYSNYQSKKGKDLESNPACALTFFWPELERQVRIEGFAARVDNNRSNEYFQSRPRSAQIGAWASPQSAVIDNRALLDARFQQMEEKFAKQDPLPRPNQWGGYEVDPFMVEFWQGRPNRLHDRIIYIKAEGKWEIRRLAP